MVQNGADAMKTSPGRIEVQLSNRCLYVANQGTPLTDEGVHALLSSHVSRKRSDEIGRFGLGFKSVAALTDSPQIFSRSGSLGFDRGESADAIRAVVPAAPKFPLLRLARPLDPDEWAERDPQLADLMTWAQTVVRVPLKGARVEVSKDLESFPRHFVLFSPQVQSLVLDNRGEHDRREITLVTRPDGVLELVDRGQRSIWRVVRTRHRPGKEAVRDAGELAAREEIELQWAVPLSGAPSTGSFWAFFPTESYTTLSGIINAPWKLSEDRRNLLEGPFNEELLTTALPRLVAGALRDLVDPGNPAAVLDLLPARGKEPRSWADGVVNIPVMQAVAQGRCLPCLDGRLRHPREVRMHPVEVLKAWLEDWREGCRDEAAWVHHDVFNAERRSKAERLMDDASVMNVVSLQVWLEALVSPPEVSACSRAVQLVARIAREASQLREQATGARVLLLENGDLRSPKRGRVFVRSDAVETHLDFIHPELAAIPAARHACQQQTDLLAGFFAGTSMTLDPELP